MGIKNTYMIKTGIGLEADAVLELKADTGESLLVKDVMINGSDDAFIEMLTEKVTTGFFRVGKALGNHLPFVQGQTKHSHAIKTSLTATGDQTVFAGVADAEGVEIAAKVLGGLAVDTLYNRVSQYNGLIATQETLIAYLIRNGYMNGYPIAEGESFIVKPHSDGKKLNDVAIIYEQYEAADMKSDMLNGSKAKEYVFVNYGDVGAAVTAKGDNLVSEVLTPVEFPDFPMKAGVPAKTEIELIGICGSEVIDWDAANDYTNTKYLKLMYEREVLFDEDRNGLLFYAPVPGDVVAGTFVGEGLSVVGNFSAYDRREPYIFKPQKIFKAGEELNVYITTDEGSTAQGSITKDCTELGFIEKVRRVD